MDFFTLLSHCLVFETRNSGYHQQQNKWYPQRCLLAHFEATLYFSRTEFTCPRNHKLVCANKFATAKIEYSFEMGTETPLGVQFILLVMVPKYRTRKLKILESASIYGHQYYQSV